MDLRSFIRRKHFYAIGIGVLLLTSLIACRGSNSLEGWTQGRFLFLYIPGSEKTDQIGYIDQKGDHFVVTPSEAGTTFAAINLTVVNPRSSRVLLSIDEASASISDPRGNRYPLADPFQNSQQVTSSLPNEGVYSPFLWGNIELQKDFQVQGWLIFEVPSNFESAVLLWEETESIRAIIN